MGRSHGLTSSTHARHSSQSPNYNVMFPGHNYRCTEITAALGLVQLEKLEEGNRRRRELTLLYKQLLDPVAGVQVLLADETTVRQSDCHILPVIFEDVAAREKVIEALAQAAIQMSHHYRSIHSFAWYASHQEFAHGPFNNSDAFSARELTLPLHPKLGEAEVQEVCDTITKAMA